MIEEKGHEVMIFDGEEYKTSTWYNPVYALNDLYIRHGFICPICDNHYDELDDVRVPYELKKMMYEEMPFTSVYIPLFGPPFCLSCMGAYRRFRYSILRHHGFTEDMTIPAAFIQDIVRREAYRVERHIQ